MKFDHLDDATIAWPLSVIDDFYDGEAVLDVSDKWRAIHRGGGTFKCRAVPIVCDTDDRVLVGLRGSVAGGNRLALPGDEAFVRNGESVFESAARALTELTGAPFSGSGVGGITVQMMAAVMRYPLLPATFELDDATKVVVLCLPLALSGQEQVSTVSATGEWVDQSLTWVESAKLLAALRGDLGVLQGSFRGHVITAGFSSALVKPLLQQLGG